MLTFCQVLFVEDFSEITVDIIKNAYVEAIYRVDEWDYKRLTTSHWRNVVFETAASENLEYILEQHPMKAGLLSPFFFFHSINSFSFLTVDESFTRPYRYFNCDQMGGCGSGTLRTPRSVCPEVQY